MARGKAKIRPVRLIKMKETEAKPPGFRPGVVLGVVVLVAGSFLGLRACLRSRDATIVVTNAAPPPAPAPGRPPAAPQPQAQPAAQPAAAAAPRWPSEPDARLEPTAGLGGNPEG